MINSPIVPSPARLSTRSYSSPPGRASPASKGSTTWALPSSRRALYDVAAALASSSRAGEAEATICCWVWATSSWARWFIQLLTKG